MKPPIPHDAWPADEPLEPFDPTPVPPEMMRRWGIGLFILSLASLFIATLVAYITIRYTGLNVPPPGTVAIPQGLGWSTAALLLCGLVIALTQRTARHLTSTPQAGSKSSKSRIRTLSQLRSLTLLAWSLSIAFLILQTPGLIQLAQSHTSNTSQNIRGADGLLFTLIALHALHVAGGLIPLSRLALRCLQGPLNQEQCMTLRSCATYWHFLEIVWLAMFATFLIVR